MKADDGARSPRRVRRPRRFGRLVGLDPARLAEYKRYHVKIWPEIEAAIRRAGIANYTIFHLRGMLYAYYEYTGPEAEYAQRMKELAAAPRMREWWDIMEPMQRPLEFGPPGAGRAREEWWADMEEVFHLD